MCTVPGIQFGKTTKQMSDGGCAAWRGRLELGLSICKPVPAGSCQDQLRGEEGVQRARR